MDGREMGTCGWCDGADFEPGFLEDRGEGSQGYVAWIQGALERGVFGRARRSGKQRWIVDASRCRTCGHLEFFATQPK